MIRYRSIHCQHRSVVCPKKLTVFSTKYRTTRVRLYCGCWKIGSEKMCLKKLWTYTWHETGKWYIDNFFFVLFKNYKKLKNNDQTIIFFFSSQIGTASWNQIIYGTRSTTHYWNWNSKVYTVKPHTQLWIHGQTNSDIRLWTSRKKTNCLF